LPAIAQKLDCLKGCVFQYVGRPDTFYYREYDSATRKYTYKTVPDATSLQDAAVKALEVFAEMRKQEASPLPITLTTQSKTKVPTSRLIEPLIEQYLEINKKRVEAGTLSQGTYDNKVIAVGMHMKAYLSSKIITRTHQIKVATFDDYVVFRGPISKLTKNKELIDIRHFLNWCIRNEYLSPKLLAQKLIKKERVTEEDLLANPAINAHDWDLITKQIRAWKQKGNLHTNPKTRYWRELFHTFCLVMKQTGMRPIEIKNLRWKDIEFLKLTDDEEQQRRAGKMSSAVSDKAATCYIFIRKTKTRTPREVPAKCGRELRRWKDFIFQFIADTKRSSYPTNDSLVFGNCDNYYRPYVDCNYSKAWLEGVREPLKGQLRGHQYSDHPYTIYSMRATFIEDNLLQPGGCDVFYLARVVGHDVSILQKHYERITVRSRASELKQIPFGQPRPQEEETTTLLSEFL
jgi:integrase